jgi:hypothetical protein
MPTGLPPRQHRYPELFPARWSSARAKKTRHSKKVDRDSSESAPRGGIVHLAMAPIAVLIFSTLMRGDAISAESLLRTLLLGAEAIAEAELGVSPGWIAGNI